VRGNIIRLHPRDRIIRVIRKITPSPHARRVLNRLPHGTITRYTGDVVYRSVLYRTIASLQLYGTGTALAPYMLCIQR